jgi:hypothetical protein
MSSSLLCRAFWFRRIEQHFVGHGGKYSSAFFDSTRRFTDGLPDFHDALHKKCDTA